jgi:hypothetical protein
MCDEECRCVEEELKKSEGEEEEEERLSKATEHSPWKK